MSRKLFFPSLSLLASALLMSLSISCEVPGLAQTASPPVPSSVKSSAAAANDLPRNWIVPVQGKLTNPFGNSYQYYQIYRGGHTGVDIAAPKGSPIKATADGQVVKIWQQKNQRYGSYIIIKHAPKLFSLYGHLEKVQVKLNQKVKQGQVIATVGVSGAAGYPHLHVEALDQVPIRDGAWGYLYICSKSDPKANFLNQHSHVIQAIQRQKGYHCLPQKLKQSINYINPEYLWTAKDPLNAHVISQPENEEKRYHKPKPKPSATPSSKGLPSISPQPQNKPSQSPQASPTASVLPSQKLAEPDKSAAPEN